MIIEFLAVCVAGGIGAALRFIVDGAVRHRTPPNFPYATMIINITGSLVLGLLTGLVLGQLVSHHWQLIIGTGMMGGYTTFSTASVETVRLVEEGRWRAGLINGLGMLVLCTAAAAGGFALGLSL